MSAFVRMGLRLVADLIGLLVLAVRPRRSIEAESLVLRRQLAGLARAGELTAIYVPDVRDEAMRDLVRAREDVVAMQQQARQRLSALLLRNDLRYAGKTAWTAAHRRWIADLRLPQAAQRLAFEEYVQAVEEANARVQRLSQCIEQEVTHWRWRPVVNALQAYRGIQLIHAVRIVAELGDLTRFSHPRELMSYLGLIPSEDSSGERRRQGAITKAGNSSVRRALVEAAWAYQYMAKVSGLIARRQAEVPKVALDIAWKAQLRLCARFRRLAARGVNRNKIVVAIARELAGFVWAARSEGAARSEACAKFASDRRRPGSALIRCYVARRMRWYLEYSHSGMRNLRIPRTHARVYSCYQCLGVSGGANRSRPRISRARKANDHVLNPTQGIVWPPPMEF